MVAEEGKEPQSHDATLTACMSFQIVKQSAVPPMGQVEENLENTHSLILVVQKTSTRNMTCEDFTLTKHKLKPCSIASCMRAQLRLFSQAI